MPDTNECAAPGESSVAGPSGTTLPSHVTPCVTPSAPGYVPKNVSNVRFSFTRNTTWRIFRRAASIVAGSVSAGAGGGGVCSSVGSGEEVGEDEGTEDEGLGLGSVAAGEQAAAASPKASRTANGRA